MPKFVPVTCAFTVKRGPNSQVDSLLLLWEEIVCRANSQNDPDKTWRGWRMQQFVQKASFVHLYLQHVYLNLFFLFLKVFFNANVKHLDKRI